MTNSFARANPGNDHGVYRLQHGFHAPPDRCLYVYVFPTDFADHMYVVYLSICCRQSNNFKQGIQKGVHLCSDDDARG